MASIAFVGLGALGAANFVQIAGHGPADIRVVAGGARGERLRREGLTANGRHFGLHVTDPAGPAEPADIVMIAVKSHDLAQAIADAAVAIGPDTTIVSLLNGITSEAAIQARYPDNFVPLAISMGSNAGKDEAGFRFYSVGVLHAGEARNDPPSERVAKLSALLDELGVAHEVDADMEHTLWKKFVLNCGINQASALLEACYEPFQRPGPARDLLATLLRETYTVGLAAGVDLTEADLVSIQAILDGLDPKGYSSMAQDAIFHRPMEIDLFADEVVRLSQVHGVPAPVNEATAVILRAKQAAWG
jgi:2-dehydropantoate 2-reductase